MLVTEQRFVRRLLKPQRRMTGCDHIVVHVLIGRTNVTARTQPGPQAQIFRINHSKVQ
jgi:hypothetical protein